MQRLSSSPQFSERTGGSWREGSCGLLSPRFMPRCGKQLLWVTSTGHVLRLTINQDGLWYVAVTDKPGNLSCYFNVAKIDFSESRAASCLLALGRPSGMHGFHSHHGGKETDGRGLLCPGSDNGIPT